MRIIVVGSYEELSRKAANVVSSQLILKPESVLGLATGDTPTGMYRELVQLFQEGTIDFSKVKTFNLDEYCNLDETSPQSYRYYMNVNLFNHVNIAKDNIHIPRGDVNNKEAECDAYEEKILTSGGIDLQILGIGRNGHIGFNEPDIRFESKTHVVTLDEDTIQANSRFFSSIDEVPKQAISMGMKTIMHAKMILLLASGKEKAQAVYNAIHGGIRPEVPVSILQLHPNAVFLLDAEAAYLLQDFSKGANRNANN